MLHLKLQSKFLGLIILSLGLLLGIFTYIVVERESRLLADKGDEKQRILADAIVAHLRVSMVTGRPRSTLDLIRTMQGSSGLIRLKALRKDGSPAFGVTGKRLEIPQLADVFSTGRHVDYLEPGEPPVRTILEPLKNEGECRECHARGEPVLGAIMVSLSMKDMVDELAASKQEFLRLFLMLVAVIGGVLYLLIHYVVLEPLITLHRGAEVVGAGDLSHRIHLKTNDEFQDLSAAFNEMNAKLEESYAGLELKISERTAQLSGAMAEVEDKAKRLYFHSRDMATISRLSTRIFNAELTMDELLDLFMRGINRGLGYQRAMLCLVDRKRAWLDIKRDTGIGALIPFQDQPLSGNGILAQLTRKGFPVTFDQLENGIGDPALTPVIPEGEQLSLLLIPILRHNPRMCWQARSCIQTACPAYEMTDARCWLMPDTLCQNALMESFHDKLSYCMTCDVFPVVGVLMVAFDRGKRFRRGRNMSVLRILASEMGAALENFRLHEDNQQMVMELLELHKVTAAALADLSLDKALEVFAESAMKFSGLDACSFWLMSEDGSELVRRGSGCAVSLDVNSDPKRLPLDQGPLGAAFSRNKLLVEYNKAADDPTLLGRVMVENGLNSLLVIPLSTEGRSVGVFSVYKKSALPFLESEIAAFMLLANQAALAINVCTLNNELKAQYRELARQTNLLRGILASMSSGVLLLDHRGTVTLINHAGVKLLQSRHENLINRRLSDLFPETLSFIQSNIGPYQEIEIRLPDNSLVPIGFSSAHFDGAGGEREGVIVVFQDLTEIRALQSELLNKERFAAMGRVVAGVAHEIRNPLFGISSIGQIFERELRNPAHLELVRALLSETKRLNQLVEELLIYGRPMKLKREQCDLRQLWEEVLGMHRDEAERKGITILGDIGIRRPMAFVDAYQIRQVLLNLLRNSIDATPAGGKIVVILALEDRTVAFKVTDTGAGIPAASLDRVFDLFFTTKSKGTGLGLAICKKIIQDHGGDISIESSEGTGTSVTVKLPFQDNAKKGKA